MSKNIKILTLFPQIINSYCNSSILLQAQKKNLVNFDAINIRDYSELSNNQIDDKQYGGGAGIVMMHQPIVKALKDKCANSYVVLLSPRGTTWNQEHANRFLQINKNITFICGHYEGIDERIDEYVDEYISIGDYIVTSGEISSLVVIDSIVRLIPGVINQESLIHESFNNSLLDYPVYTRPEIVNGNKVPDILLSGHHKKIEEYRLKERIRLTKKYKPDLYKKYLKNKNLF